MNQYLTFMVLGLGAGALYAALAQGIVLTFRGSGVINLSNGAIAMYVAYTYAGLRNRGELMIPPLVNPLALVEGVGGWFGYHWDLPSWPTLVHISDPMSTVPALLISAGVSVVLGLIIYWLIYRPLRYAAPLAKTVASIGLLLTLQAIVILRFGTENVVVPSSLPSGTVKVGASRLPIDRFILGGLVLVLCVVLTAAFRYTRIGLATRAASENEKGAILLGLSPGRLAAINWMTSSLVSGVVGVLFSSITGLNPVDYVLFVVPALGAALAAGLESFAVAALVGLLIGCAESVTVVLQTKYHWVPTGFATGIPFVVIIVAITVRGRKLPERGALSKVKLPASPEPRAVLRTGLVLTLLTLAGLIFFPYDLRSAIDNSLIGAVIALSFVVIVGFAGQISLAQLGIAGLAGLLMTRFAGDYGIPFPFSGVLAMVGAAVAGILVGLPALRVRGVQLAVITLGAGYVFENMVLNNTTFLRLSDASSSVPVPSIGSFDFGANGSFFFGSSGSPDASFGIFLLIVAIGCFAAVIALRRSDLGRRMLAVRSNERAAAGLGISISRVKLVAFAISAVLAGLAGVLLSYQFQGVTASPYIALASVSALAIAYLGGISTVSGAVYAGVLTTGGLGFRILERVAHLGKDELLIAGLGLVLTAVLNPEGIAGVMRDTMGRVRAYAQGFSSRRRASGSADASRGQTSAGRSTDRPAETGQRADYNKA